MTVSVRAPTMRPFEGAAGVALTASSFTKSPRRATPDAISARAYTGAAKRGGVFQGLGDMPSGEAQSQQGDLMAVGPVDVYIIGFPGNKFTGRIAPAIMELVENGTIRVLDLLFVMKDADGAVTTLEAADIDEDGPAFLSIDIAQPGALGPEDAEEVSDDLPANSSALLVAIENLWAAKLETIHLTPRICANRYLESVFHMSWVAFQDPSLCFFQVHRYFPFSVTNFPSAPL